MVNEIFVRLPKPHAAQSQILTKAKRFNHIRCGRRFGKTELVNELSIPAIEGYKIGIWFPTYKDLFKVWLRLKSTFRDVIINSSETLKHIATVNNGEIDFWSMEDPDSGRGFDYDRAILDEAAKAKKLKIAWYETIRSTLIDRCGDAFIMSTPKGMVNDFYKIDKATQDAKDWCKFHFKTHDNPFIPIDEIEATKSQMDDYTYQQEILALYVDTTNMPFLYSFSDSLVVDGSVDDRLPIWLSFDFNVDPMTCIAGQRLDSRSMRIFREFKIMNGSTPEMCEMIDAAFPNWRFMVTGDATGRNRTSLVKGSMNHWQYIRKYFALPDIQIKVRRHNISLLDSRLLCNAVVQNATIEIDPGCTELIDQLKFAKVDEYGVLVKDRNDNKNDLLDGFRYLIDANFPQFLAKTHKRNGYINNGVARNNGRERGVLAADGILTV